MTFVIGLTGGIGSGKTTTADFFKELGVPVIDADLIAKALVAKGSEALSKIIEHFGSDLLLDNGELNRSALREIIFENNDERLWLQSLLHPAIQSTIQQEIRKVTAPYCIVVIPLLAENFNAYQHLLNHIIVVQASEFLQVARVSERDKTPQETIKKMLHTQASPAERLKIAQSILHNTGSLEELCETVKTLHLGFLQKSQQFN